MGDQSQLMKRQQVLADFGDFVLDHEDLDDILNEGCRLVARALDTDLAKVIEIEQEAGTGFVRAGVGWNPGVVGHERVSLAERSSEAYAIATASPVVTNDMSQEHRFQFPQFLRDHGVIALVNVPILLPGRRPWGILQVDARRVRTFHQEDIEFLKTYAMVLGPAIDRLRVAAEREEARRGMAHREQQLRTVLEVIGDRFYVLDRHWRFQFASRSALMAWGKDQTDVLGRVFLETFPEAAGSAAYEAHQRVMAGGEAQTFETISPVINRWIECTVSSTADGGVSVAFRDIDDRKRAEAALRESERNLHAVANIVPDLLWYSQPDGSTPWYNDRWLEYTGQTFEQARGWGWSDAIHPDDRERSAEQYREAVHQKRSLRQEHRIRRHTGEYHWFLVRSEPICDEQGRVTRMYGAATDIHDNRLAMEALQESEERFRLFVENVREYALVQTDFEGSITSWNPGAERLFGYDSAEVVGKPFSMLIPRKDRHDGLIAREMAALSRGERSSDAHFMERKNGSCFFAEWVTEPVLDDTGKLRGTARVMHDETERQRSDVALRASLAEKEELLKEVHHRVKNNLQVIVSLLNMQSRQIPDAAVLSHFQEARNRVLAIASIHELLYRAESFAGVVLTEYASQLAPGLIGFYGLGSRVTLTIEGGDNKLELERAVPFGMLLNELVSNACKHAFPAPGAGTIIIRIDPDGEAIVLTVTDNGKGLPEGFQYQKATSLGLKLVHALARQLHGTVEVSSAQGTTLRVRFPATTTEVRA